MSMVRFLVYSNEFDVEGLVAVTSTWMRNAVRPDVIRTVIDAYAQVQPNLLQARTRFPRADALSESWPPASLASAWRRSGPTRCRPVRSSSSARRTRRTSRPLWITRVGRSEHAGAGAAARARATRTPAAARRASSPSFASTRSPIRTMRVRGFGGSFRRCTTSRCPRRRTAISTTYGDVDRHQRRSLLQERAGRRLHDVHRRVGEREHPQQGSARQALSVSRAASTKVTRRRSWA